MASRLIRERRVRDEAVDGRDLVPFARSERCLLARSRVYRFWRYKIGPLVIDFTDLKRDTIRYRLFQGTKSKRGDP